MIIDALIKDGWKATNEEATAAAAESTSSSSSSSVTVPSFTPSGLSELRFERQSSSNDGAVMMIDVRAMLMSRDDSLVIHGRIHTRDGRQAMDDEVTLTAAAAAGASTSSVTSSNLQPSTKILPLCIQYVSRLTQQQQQQMPMMPSPATSLATIPSIQQQAKEWIERINDAARLSTHPSTAHRSSLVTSSHSSPHPSPSKRSLSSSFCTESNTDTALSSSLLSSKYDCGCGHGAFIDALIQQVEDELQWGQWIEQAIAGRLQLKLET